MVRGAVVAGILCPVGWLVCVPKFNLINRITIFSDSGFFNWEEKTYLLLVAIIENTVIVITHMGKIDQIYNYLKLMHICNKPGTLLYRLKTIDLRRHIYS